MAVGSLKLNCLISRLVSSDTVFDAELELGFTGVFVCSAKSAKATGFEKLGKLSNEKVSIPVKSIRLWVTWVFWVVWVLSVAAWLFE